MEVHPHHLELWLLLYISNNDWECIFSLDDGWVTGKTYTLSKDINDYRFIMIMFDSGIVNSIIYRVDYISGGRLIGIGNVGETLPTQYYSCTEIKFTSGTTVYCRLAVSKSRNPQKYTRIYAK